MLLLYAISITDASIDKDRGGYMLLLSLMPE